jgi:hypothetical protein
VWKSVQPAKCGLWPAPQRWTLSERLLVLLLIERWFSSCLTESESRFLCRAVMKEEVQGSRAIGFRLLKHGQMCRLSHPMHSNDSGNVCRELPGDFRTEEILGRLESSLSWCS